jgi:predicted signal transduction protein with EAL and GGDEF domain
VSGWLSYVRDDERQVELGVAVLRRVTEAKRVEEQMRHMAYTDALTGLPNRAFSWERFGAAVRIAKQEEHSVGSSSSSSSSTSTA